jgi:hypothetical protein
MYCCASKLLCKSTEELNPKKDSRDEFSVGYPMCLMI